MKPPSLPRIPFKLGLPRLPGASSSGRESLVVSHQGDWLKIVSVRKSSGKKSQIQHFAALSVKDKNDEQVAAEIADFCGKNGLTRPGITLLHPTRLITTRTLSLPSTDPEEIRGIVDLQAAKQTPYSREEIVTEYQLIDTDTTGYSRVMIAICQRDVLNRYVDLAVRAGTVVDQIIPGFQGLVLWYQFYASPEDKSRCVAIADIDIDTTDLVILHKGRIAFNRSFTSGAHDFKQDFASACEGFLNEIRLSFETYRTEAAQSSLPIEKFVLTGQAETFPELAESVHKELDIQAMTVSVFSRIALSKTAASDWTEAGSKEISFASMAGLALGESTMNFLPPEVRLRKSLEERGKELVFLGTFAIVAVAFIFGIVGEKIYRYASYFDWLEKKLAVTELPAAQVEKSMLKVQLIQSRLNNESGFLELLREVTGLVPEQIYLNTISFEDKTAKLSLRGTSTEMSSVFKFVSTLEESRYLSNVKTGQASKRKVGQQDMTDFEITCDINKEPEKEKPQ